MEEGFDAGGLFKEFLIDLSDKVFDPGFGMFILSHSTLQQLYPNPKSASIFGED